MTIAPRSPAAQGAGEGLPAIALRVWQSRSGPAQAMVRAGKWTAQEADEKLRPWAAVAVLCWAAIFEARIAEHRRPIVFYYGDGRPGDYAHQFGEDDGRADAARDLCPRSIWEPVLSQAAAAAIDVHEGRRTAQSRQAATDLLVICRALDVAPAATRLPDALPERMAA